MDKWFMEDSSDDGDVFFNNPMANSGANFSKYFDLRRRANEVPKGIDVATRRKIFVDFMKRPMCLKIDTFTLALGEEASVILDDSALSQGFPVETLPFFIADEDLMKKYDTELQIVDEVYKALHEITVEHLMPLKYIQEGNSAIVYFRNKYRRAVILSSLDLSANPTREDVKNENIRCCLLDNGLDVTVRANLLYYTLRSFLELPPRIFKFRLWGLADYSNTTEYFDIVSKTLVPKGTKYIARIVELNEPQGFADIILTTRQHQAETINHIILKGLFSIYSGPMILADKTFFPRVYIANMFPDGSVAIHIETPLLQHFKRLISATKSKMVEALKTTGGQIVRGETYIYTGKVDTYRVYAQSSSSADCQTVQVVAIDVGSQFLVNKMELAHIDLFKGPSDPFNILRLIPQLVSHVHLANIGTLDLGETGDWFDTHNPYIIAYFLRQFTVLPKSTVREVDLYSEQFQLTPGAAQTLNQAIISGGLGTESKTVVELDSFCKSLSSFSINSEEGNWG